MIFSFVSELPPTFYHSTRLGEDHTSIHQWRKELSEHSSEAFPGSGHQTAQEEEVRRLKRELEVVKQERDIVKKSHRGFLLAELVPMTSLS